MPSDILIARTKNELRQRLAGWRARGEKIGFVPTMGALHAGHLSLLSLVREQSDRIVSSVFVNPTQFAPGEDFDAYPRDEADDLAKLASAGCDLVYLPSAEEMYPPGSLTNVRVEGMSDLLDGGPRPHFFYGVATVVARLFIHVAPDVAAFGEKDFQQLQIIRRMTRDLGFPIDILGGATARDADGLALSSRNAYLTPEDRRRASALHAALHRAAVRIELGVPLAECVAEARARLVAGGWTKIDYVAAVDPDTLEDLPDGPAAPGCAGRLLGAGWVGKTRLIDNLGFQRPT